MVIQFNESQMMVVTGDLDQSYKILGQINYTEPVSGEAIDTDHINARLPDGDRSVPVQGRCDSSCRQHYRQQRWIRGFG